MDTIYFVDTTIREVNRDYGYKLFSGQVKH